VTRQARPSDPAAAASGAASAPSGRRISPGVVILAIALIGSFAFVLYTITVRDVSQIPLFASGAVVLGLVFGALAAYTLRATWRAGVAERNGRAVALGLFGGFAAMISFGCFALAIIMFMLRQPPT
jgi:ABC-type arginine transport system permease subunit